MSRSSKQSIDRYDERKGLSPPKMCNRFMTIRKRLAGFRRG
jgi:hypothetical protein